MNQKPHACTGPSEFFASSARLQQLLSHSHTHERTTPPSIMLALLAGALSASTATGQRVHIDPATGHFVGVDGRVRIFHGVNVVQKGFPWLPSRLDFDASNSLVAEDMRRLRSWGINVIRLGVMWPGVEPSDGSFNETYLSEARALVDELHSHGLFTIVDFHQDVIARKWCGEGVPDWLQPMLRPITTACGSVVGTVAKLIGQCQPFSSFNLTDDPHTGAGSGVRSGQASRRVGCRASCLAGADSRTWKRLAVA